MNEAQPLRRSFIAGREALFLWVVSLLVFLFGIWHQPFINFETRFAVFAQEMLLNGLTLFPTTYGKPYPDYPVTSTVLIWLFSLPFGQVTKFSAVLPTALASATVVALTYKLFAEYSREWGILAVGFEFLTVTFLADARSISLDQIVSAICLSAFYLTHMSYRKGLALPMKRLVFLLLSGFLIRGPIGVVLPAGVVLSHLLATSKWGDVFKFAAWSAVTLVACATAQLGLAWIIYGQEFVNDIIKMQAVSRFADSAPLPKYYYFSSSLWNYALSYPIAISVALMALYFKFIKRSTIGNKEHSPIIMILLCWIAILFVGLSIPETKKVRYLLPAVPALAGLASYAFINNDLSLMKWVRRCSSLVLIILPFLAAVLVYTQKGRFESFGLNHNVAMGVFLSLFLANISMAIFQYRNEPVLSAAFMFINILAALYLKIAIVEPIDLRLHDTSKFVGRIESLIEKNPGNLLFYKENPDGLPIKYLVNAKADIIPEFIVDLESIKNSRTAVWLLAKETNLDDIKKALINTSSVIYRERFGDLPYLAVFVPAAPHDPVPSVRALP